ncbi:MAG: hypothetical protein ACUVTX_06320 [Bacteroidales bacterium]
MIINILNTEKIHPHLAGIILQLKNIRNNSIARSFMRILSFEDMKNFGEQEQGVLADYCLESLNAPETPLALAIKVYAMEILYRLTIIYPELGNKVTASIRSVMEEGSPGIVARGRAILRKITDITSGS